MLLVFAARLARLRDRVKTLAIETQMLQGMGALEIPDHVFEMGGELFHLGPFLLLALSKTGEKPSGEEKCLEQPHAA
jgi:hypothetical protein